MQHDTFIKVHRAAPQPHRVLVVLSALVAIAWLASACTDDAQQSAGTTTTAAQTGAGAGGATSGTAGGSSAGGGGIGGSDGGAGGQDCPDTVLPGSIAGVEPESVSHHPPIRDGNGNLYRMIETTSAEGNNPGMMKSTDGGASWAEVDAANRPSARDLEGTYQLRVGSTVYFSVSRGYRVWWVPFHTSDAATMPDTWGNTEMVEEYPSQSGVKQFSSLTQTSDGRFWIFFSDELADGRQQIGFRQRTGVDTYSGKSNVDAASGSWTGPRAVLGANDVTHLFYKDDVDDRLYWRTLSAAGVLSAATRIDENGTSGVPIPHAHPVIYQRGNAELIMVAFAGSDDTLKAVTLVDGVVGSEEQLSLGAVLQDADVVTNEGAVAHLTLEGSTVHAIWVEDVGGDITHSAKQDQGSWSGETTLWSSAAEGALYVYCSVIDDGCARLSCTFDVGPHGDDTGNINYTEVVLSQ